MAVFARLLARHPAKLIIKYHHLLSDADSAYLQRIKELAAPLGNQVRFIGSIPYEQLPAVYAAADVAVSVPMADGTPASFLELVALGVPLVAADLPDYADILQHGQSAVLVKEPTPEKLADALEFVCEDPAYRARLVVRAGDFVRKEGTWERTVEEFLQIHGDALARQMVAP